MDDMKQKCDSSPSSSVVMTPEMRSALAALCLQVVPIWSRQLEASRAQSAQAVGTMLSAFSVINSALNKHLPQGSAAGVGLQPYIEQMYLGLQYQDRLSQMMTLVQEDMTRLHEALVNPTQDSSKLAVETWLERLESLYVMVEQRRGHGAEGHEADSLSDERTSFF